MTRDAPETWTRRVARWRSSGLSASEFAAQAGLNPHTLAYWGRRLRAGPGQSEAAAAEVAPAPCFVEVLPLLPWASAGRRRSAATAPPMVPAAGGGAVGEQMEVVLRDGLRVRVATSFDATALRRLVVALEGR